VNIDIKSLIMPVVILLLALCGWYYHGQYKQASADLKLAKSTITDMQTRQRDVAALDAKYTKELADAKASNDSLRNAVDDGRKRLRIAIAKNNPTTTPGMGDAGTAELADSVRQDYYDLRSMIAFQDKQLRAAQEYIKTQCLR
jgi:prophage endopeptidase